MVAYYSFYGLLLLVFIWITADIVFCRSRNDVCGKPVKRNFFLSALCGIILLLSDVFFGKDNPSMPAADMLVPLSMVIAIPTKDVINIATVAFPSVVSVIAILTSSLRVYFCIGATGSVVPTIMECLPCMICAVTAAYVILIVWTGNSRHHGMADTGLPDSLRTGDSISMLSVFMMLSVFSCCHDMPASSLDAYPVIVSLGAAVVMALRYLHAAGICRAPALLSGSGRYPSSSPVSARPSQSGSMKELYDRITVLFEQEMPYLDGDLTISHVARELYTNKAYISRAVNEFTGKNFCQYVNHYRIMHAMKLFQENPCLRVSELAEMSGFHTQVSFNMAFRLVMEESPGEWCRKVRMEFEKERRKKGRL